MMIRILVLCRAFLIVSLLTLLSACVTPSSSQLDVAERILGPWEGNLNGAPVTLDMDGYFTNPGGAIQGNAYYNIRNDVIIVGFSNEIIAMQVSFPSEHRSLWTGLTSDQTITYERPRERRGEDFTEVEPPESRPPETADLIRDSIQGRWVAADNESEILVIDDYFLSSGTNSTVRTPYLMIANSISYNGVGGIQRRAVMMPDADMLFMTDPETGVVSSFVRRD